MPNDHSAVFGALREILRKHSRGLLVLSDTPTDFTLATRAVLLNKQPMWFGCVKSGKSAVSYHLMPLYVNPRLQAAVPPELLPRKQGKTCFNFKRPDPKLFAMLDELTRLGREQFEKHGLLEPGPISREKIDAAARAGGAKVQARSKGRRQPPAARPRTSKP